MKTYISHKEVDADEIKSLERIEYTDTTVDYAVTMTDGEFHLVKAEVFSRYMPVPGDFLVRYKDGYLSVSPRQAFIDGYKLKE